MRTSFLLVLAILFSQVASAKTFVVRLKESLGVQTTRLQNQLQTVRVRKIPVKLGNFYLVDIQDEATLNRLKKLSTYNGVMSVDKNIILSSQPLRHNYGADRLTAEDKLFNKQWALKNTASNVNDPKVRDPKSGVDVNALKAWNMEQGSKAVTIAVIDTGINYKHPDLKDNMWINEQEAHGKPGVDDDGNGYVDDIHGYDFVNTDGDPMDDNDHGTHCAGIIGATHNAIGVRGMMKDVKLMAIKFLSSRGGGSFSDALLAIDYAINNGAQIISNSWGASANPPKALIDIVKEAEKKGITFVIAAGNSNSNNDRSGNTSNIPVDNVIAVGSHQGGEGKSYFSSYGAKNVHVFAPGSVIMSTVSKGQDYQAFSGTSMATPYVSGIAGLLKAMNPEMTPKEIKERLINTSIKSDGLKNYSVSQGRVDAYRALSNIQ